MSSIRNTPPILLIVGYSEVGKTTLIEKLIPELVRQGLRVGTIKHHHGSFELDRPGKDSWRHKHAGASASMISSPTQIGMVIDLERDHELDQLAAYFTGMDIILTEGYKKENQPKLEVFRPEVHQEPICKGDKNLIGVVSDAAIDMGVVRFTTNDIKGLSEFLVDFFGLRPHLSLNHKEAAS